MAFWIKIKAAAEIANLSWLMFGLATVVFVAVMGLLLVALFIFIIRAMAALAGVLLSGLFALLILLIGMPALILRPC